MTLFFKIELLDVDSPKVWRTVLVPDRISFHKFHQLIQALFGWYELHLYEFSPEGMGYYSIITHPDCLPEDEYINSVTLRLNKYFDTKGQELIYTYDFGDSWEHKIKLEKILPEGITKAIYVDAGGACPPEDCGGPPGYEHRQDGYQ